MASLQEMGITGFRSTSEFLDQLPYLGDRTLCKMSAEQANAYAEVLESLPEYAEGFTLYALLADPAGDGMPLLITAYAGPDTRYFDADSLILKNSYEDREL